MSKALSSVVALCLLATAASAEEPAEPAASLRRRTSPAAEWNGFPGAVLELGAIFAVGTTWYLLGTEANQPDWRYDFSWSTFEKKLITHEAVDYDDNPLYLNLPGHAVAGAGYYLAARNNRSGVALALISAVGMSSLWELTTEYREIVAINDMIVTPAGGFAIGESLYQLSEFFLRSEPTPVNTSVARVLAGPSSFYPWRRQPQGARRWDADGWSTDTWHHFSLYGGTSAVATEGGRVPFAGIALGGQARLVHRTGDGLGRSARFIGRPLATRMRLEMMMRPDGLAAIEAYAHSTFLGAYGQSLEPRGADVQGWSGHLGLSTFYEHWERPPLQTRDQVAMVSPLGPSAHVTLEYAGFRLLLEMDMHPVFGAVFSQGLWSNPGRDDVAALPPVLAKNGYYWSFGARGSTSAALRYAGAELGASLRWYGLREAQGAFSGKGPLLAEQRLSPRMWLELPIYPTDLALMLRFDQEVRLGALGRSRAQAAELVGQLLVVWNT